MKDDFEIMYGKIPPQAIDLEEAVLGALMLERDAFEKVAGTIKAECFYKDAHQKIFGAISSLFEKSLPIDLLTVVEELRSKEDLESVGGPWYITTLTNKVASTANLEGHTRIIFEKYVKREIIRIAGEMIKDGYDDSSDAFEVCEKVEKLIFNLSGKTLKSDFEHISTIAFRGLKKIDELRNREYVLTGVPTGYSKLDHITNGWQSTDLIVIAARPSVGKTAFALNLILNAAFSEEKQTNCALFSLEMSKEQIFQRMSSIVSLIPLQWIKTGKLSDGKNSQLTESVERMCEKKIFIDDTASLGTFELRAKSRRLKSKHDIGLIVVDYLQLMSSEKTNRTRDQEIGFISAQLKALAKELEIPVIALAQLNREVEKRGGIPKLSDLRESGSIEQDADIVSFLWRASDEDIKKDADLKNNGYLKFGKHRNGVLDDIEFYCDMSIQKWFDYDKGIEYSKGFRENLLPIDLTGYKDYSEPQETPF